MSFTDEDLKRFKDFYGDPKRGDFPLKVRALLVRMECAVFPSDMPWHFKAIQWVLNRIFFWREL